MYKRDWHNLYFGRVSKTEVQEAINDYEWQKLRKELKGKSTEEKYDMLLAYYVKTKCAILRKGDSQAELRKLQVRITNYVTALSRGGLIRPSDYK